MRNGLEIDNQGTKRWFLNDQLHREDGPAIEYPNGSKLYHQHGNLHREDGPAVEYSNGYKAWHIDGFFCTEEEHARLVNLKMFW